MIATPGTATAKKNTVTVPAKSLGGSKKFNNFFPVIVRPLKSSFTEKGLYTAVFFRMKFYRYRTNTFSLAAVYVKVNLLHFLRRRNQ